MISRASLFLLMGVFLSGCASINGSAHSANPGFGVTRAEARAAITEMRRDKRPFPRPVVVAAGYMDPGIGCAHVGEVLRGLTPDRGQVIVVPFFSVSGFESSRARLIEFVGSRFPSDDPARTTEVDVVAISMGGLVARDAAIGRDDDRPSLRIKRLFTISTPHRGAGAASLPSLDRRVRAMRAGSGFLGRLDGATIDYEIVGYVRLGDEIVGEANAVPPGGAVHWVPNAPLEFAHLQAHRDPRILADIARRLRGEEPLSGSPAAPLPE